VGLDVWVYTVNEPEEMRRVMDLGVDALVTDRPDLLARLLRRETTPQ
jgi:glycerophosphoryl diester phosphodiesterase